MKRFILLLLLLLIVKPVFASSQEVSFKDKQITMFIGFAAGGGTDLAGRQIARFLGKHLPGQPTIIVRNQPGADGITVLNFISQQTKPDGLTITMGSSSQVDPLNYRAAKAVYDPTAFFYIGGVGRERTVVIINSEAEKRLYNKNAQPAIMGSVGIPRSSMQITAWGIEHLGWNAKWVIGYPGSNEVNLALDRGEIDMTSTINIPLVEKLINTRKFSVLTQAGNMSGDASAVSPAIKNAPSFPQQMQGKIHEPISQKAFDYWISLNSVDKWLALMPTTPTDIVETYREAFRNVISDPDFLKTSKIISEDFYPITYTALEEVVHILAATPVEAIGYTSSLLRKQGIHISD